jgi:hypothetical protein
VADIEVYNDGGEIAPYNPGMPVLAPLSPAPDTWGNNDLLRDDQHHHQPSGPTLFGATLPVGSTPQHVQVVLAEIGGLYLSDFTKLNYPSALIQSAIAFFMENATKPARQVTPRHSFKLPNELANDWLATLFANHLQTLGGTQQQKQQFLNASLAWIDRLNARLGSQQLGENQGKPAQGRAPTSDPTENLTDQQFAVLVKHNENVKAQTMGRLEQRWGQCFRQNLALAQAHLNKMTPVEIAHFERYTGSWPWTHFLNSYEGLVGLFEMSIGMNSMPTNGPAIAQEILQIEALMREPATRRAYLKDDVLQARYRQLLSLTLGGR